jgi:hypothetical protein
MELRKAVAAMIKRTIFLSMVDTLLSFGLYDRLLVVEIFVTVTEE